MLYSAEASKVFIWTDFVCPYCLIGEQLISEALKGLNVEIVWLPLELRPYPTPTLRPEDNYLKNAWNQHVYATAEHYGVSIRLPSVSPQPYTRLAFIGMQYALDQGLSNEYVLAVLKAFFQGDKDIGSLEVLVEAAASLGLDAEDFEAALADPKFAARHDTALNLASMTGVRSVPTVLFDNQIYSGIRDVELIRTAVINKVGGN